jgi:hypothetical protein
VVDCVEHLRIGFKVALARPTGVLCGWCIIEPHVNPHPGTAAEPAPARTRGLPVGRPLDIRRERSRNALKPPRPLFR